MLHLGIDLGGTNVAAAVVDDGGAIVGRAVRPTPRGAGLSTLADAVAEAGRAAAESAGAAMADLSDAGLGTPGAVEAASGTVVYCSTFSLHDAPLGPESEARLGLPVRLVNDADAAACGEMLCGAGRGVKSLIAVTFGTGIGGGIIVNGRLLTGCNGAAGEIGHMVIRAGGKQCACGRRGCYERYASATALIERTREAMEAAPDSALRRLSGGPDGVTGRTAFDAAALGDAAAQDVVRGYLADVACGLVNLVQIFQPERIVLGGGISGQGEALLGPVRSVLGREDYARHHTKRTELSIAALGNDAGLIGAALIRRFD